jgi:hypothetical protein
MSNFLCPLPTTLSHWHRKVVLRIGCKLVHFFLHLISRECHSLTLEGYAAVYGFPVADKEHSGLQTGNQDAGNKMNEKMLKGSEMSHITENGAQNVGINRWNRCTWKCLLCSQVGTYSSRLGKYYFHV